MSSTRKRASSTQLTQFFKRYEILVGYRVDKEGRAAVVASSSTEVITTEENGPSLEPMSDVERPDESPHMPCDVSPLMEEECLDEAEGTIDLGAVIREANGSWDKLRSLVHHLSDEKKKQYLSFHLKPCQGDTLHSHPVTKKGKTWNVSLQLRWLQDFTWLSYSQLLSGVFVGIACCFQNNQEEGMD